MKDWVPVFMRILYHHRTRATDAQRIHILELIRAFRTLGHHVQEVALVSVETRPQDGELDSKAPGWKTAVRALPFGSEILQVAYNFAAIPILVGKVFRSRPDFIYERYALFNFAGVLTARLLRLPIVVEVNSPLALEQRREGEITAYRVARLAEKCVCNLADLVIAVSGPLRRILIEEGVDSRKIAVLSNGVDPDSFATGSEQAKVKSRLPRPPRADGKILVGFVGWFRRWHRLDLLLEAFRESSLLRDRAAVLLVGDGPGMPSLQKLVRTWHLDDSVIFTGLVPHEQVPGYLALIDIAVQPFANEYCCPMKILEYLAVGKAIVAPDQENIRELVRDRREARLFRPGDKQALAAALEELVLDADLRRELARRAREAISSRKLTWIHNAERVIELVAGTC